MMVAIPTETDLFIAYKHYVRTVTNIQREDAGKPLVSQKDMDTSFMNALEKVKDSATRTRRIEAYEKVYSREHIDQLPRHTCIQGYDGFMHVVVDEGVFTLATGSSHNAPHDSRAIELPATIRYRPNQEHLKRENS